MNQRSQWLNRLAITPIPVLVLALVVVWLADVRVAWTSPSLSWLVHYGCAAIGVLFIVLPASRVFLASGQPCLLMLGCGVLMWETGRAAALVGFAHSDGTGFGIYSISVVLSALCHFTGVALIAQRKIRLRRPVIWLTVTYAMGAALMGLVIAGAFAGWMPEFFIKDQGGTLLRNLVVSTAVMLFVITASLLGQTYRRVASPFLYWYALGLVLAAIGLSGSLMIAVRDSPLQWLTRFTQVVGLIYMCGAMLALMRESRAGVIPLAAVEDAWQENEFLASLRQQTPWAWMMRYGLAVISVAAAMAWWVTVTEWIGSELPPYILFFPVVTIVALLAGLGPGIVATLASGFVVGYWIIPPVGRPIIASSVDWFGMAIFISMGLFLSTFAELYRRTRDKAATYDRELALRESRETLRQQVELIDPVRAAVIVREMQRVVRERTGADTAPQVSRGQAPQQWATWAGSVVACVGLLALLGWTFDIELLKNVRSSATEMKVNTAICFLLAGISLALRERHLVRIVCAGIL
ncbi:MAG: DUF4118 domain-containing protein, partial [Pirellulaceae bacterium]